MIRTGIRGFDLYDGSVWTGLSRAIVQVGLNGLSTLIFWIVCIHGFRLIFIISP